MKRAVLLFTICLLPFKQMMAQGCSVCTQTANQLGDEGALGLNSGIIYLAFLPITFISVIGFIWWRYNRQAKS